MKPNGIIQRKLSLLDDQVLQLRQHLAGVSREKFRDDWVLRSMAERALQVAIEIVIDIAERLLAGAGAGPAATAAEAIDKCVQLGLLQSTSPYKDMVRYRNLIVHEYERIDPDITFALATAKLDDFRAFRAEIDHLTS
ncbi:MAG: DUF86 domain-containing protein [Sedimentisphaerales bacterium]|nr:DUF86 domain-containing protein [Sedimentisphaerales bacterium]